MHCDSGWEGSDGQSDTAVSCHMQTIPADRNGHTSLCASCSRLSNVNCCPSSLTVECALAESCEDRIAACISPIDGAYAAVSPRSSSPSDFTVVCTEPQYIDANFNAAQLSLISDQTKEHESLQRGSKQVFFNGIISCYDDADIDRHSSDDEDASSNDTDVDFIQADDNPDDVIGLSDSSHSHDSLPTSVVIEMPDVDDDDDGLPTCVPAGDRVAETGAAAGGGSQLHFSSNCQYGGRRSYVAGKVQARLNGDTYMTQYWDKMAAARQDCPSLDQCWNGWSRSRRLLFLFSQLIECDCILDMSWLVWLICCNTVHYLVPLLSAVKCLNLRS